MAKFISDLLPSTEIAACIPHKIMPDELIAYTDITERTIMENTLLESFNNSTTLKILQVVC